MPDKIAIAFENVTKTYPSYHHVTGGIKSFLFNVGKSVKELKRRTLALEDINLEIKQGESFGFIGRNGAGKSTSLGLVAGVLTPDSGRVMVNGRVSPLLELGAGFHAELTGRENILLNGVLLGLTQDKVFSHIDEIIEFSGLDEFIEQPVRTYSSGMYAKLGFSVVANLSPEILLVDEILSVGDYAFAEKCIDKFEEFKANEDVTIVLVSHTLDAVKQVCDRVAWIDGHRLKMLGPAEDVVEAYVDSVSPKKCIAVPAYIEKVPPYVASSLPYLDCSQEQSKFSLNLTYVPHGTRVNATLVKISSGSAVQSWLVSGDFNKCAPLLLSYSEVGFELSVPDETLNLKVGHKEVENACHHIGPNDQFALQLYAEGLDWSAHAQRTFCPVFVNTKGREDWERFRGHLLRDYGKSCELRAPLWPEGCTVRIVARNIFLRDAVGHFALGVIGMLSQAGVPVRVYSYVCGEDLAGIVQPITSLEKDICSEDIVFYNYSIEDEFLDLVSNLTCKKVLYYHNVTPSKWFRPFNPDFAAVLDRSREQFAGFDKFDVALANSEFSLNEIAPYLRASSYKTTCPPTLNPARLHNVEKLSVPEPSGRVILWVGRMVPHKRPELAIKIFGELSKQFDDLSMIMVGGGLNDIPEYAVEVHAVLDALPLEFSQKVKMYPSVNDEELRSFYESADIFLTTSAHEGYCVPIHEALSFGLPVFALPQDAILETLNGSGVILSESLLEAVAEISGYLNDLTKCQELSGHSLARAVELNKNASGEQIWSALLSLI